MELRNELERKYGAILGSSTISAIEDATAKVDEQAAAYARLQAEQERMTELAGEFSSTLVGGIEDAIFAGESLEETLQGIAVELAKITLRALALDPLETALKGGLSGSGVFGSIFGRKTEGAPGAATAGVSVAGAVPGPHLGGPDAAAAALGSLTESAEGTATALGTELSGEVTAAAAKTAVLSTAEVTASGAMAELAIAATTAAIALEAVAAASATSASAGLLGTAAGVVGFGGAGAPPGQSTVPGPHLAHGGRVQAGQAVITGERGPEPFIPDRAGFVVSNQNFKEALAEGGAPRITNNLRMTVVVEGADAARGFQRSENQIFARATRALQRASSRNN